MADYPSPLPWEERAKGVQPLPGGYDGYLVSLRKICDIVNELHPTASDLADSLMQHFGELQTLRSARNREAFLRKVGIITVRDERCYVSDQTAKWLQTGDVDTLMALIHSRMCFFGEMLAEVQTPRRPEELRSIAEEKYGLKWNTTTQVQLRRGWLQSAKVIQVTEDQRLVVTKAGQKLVRSLKLHSPGCPADVPKTISNGDKGFSPTRGSEGKGNDTAQVEDLANSIVGASTDSKNSDRFEEVVRQAFSFLGFEASRLGGSGKTDVLLDAPLGFDEKYRVTVDAKTVGAGVLVDGQVDWPTLKEHRIKHRADYAALVGPEPSSGRLTKRAEEHEITVLSASLLAGLCRQHAEAPLGLADYRTLFARQSNDGTWIRRGGEVDTADLDEAAGEGPRMRVVAAAIVKVLSERCMTVGPLRARDLWLIMLERGEMAEGSSKDEIQGLLDMLAHPLVRAVDGDAESGYVPSSKPAVTRMRLQHLITSVAPEAVS